MSRLAVKQPKISELSQKYGHSEEDIKRAVEFASKSMELVSQRIPVSEVQETIYYTVVRTGLGLLDTPYGKMWQYTFRIDDQWERYNAIVKAKLNPETLNPNFEGLSELIVRTDSGCESGQLFLDETCDCRLQLHKAMEIIAQKEAGLVITIPGQDGRGMGLPFKLATLYLQDLIGLDTVESAGLLAPGGIIDVRTYAGVISILKFFQVSTSTILQIATNNPHKEAVFKENGYQLGDSVPVVVGSTSKTGRHLSAKKKHLDHRDIGE
jgi:3,4-dihydroxy 2-butanone 4-phosphate synthase / GTP cyclohydrolase II